MCCIFVELGIVQDWKSTEGTRQSGEVEVSPSTSFCVWPCVFTVYDPVCFYVPLCVTMC